MDEPRDEIWGNDAGRGTFARRVRALVAHRGWTLASLAETTSIDPSFLSRLLAEREETRREPQLEHVLAIARSLGLSPFKLVMGTDAVHVLGQWVPRRELEAEVERRLEAQQAVRKREGDLAGLRAELEQLRSEMNMLAYGAANAESEARALRMQRATLFAERDVARAQRDEAVRAHDELTKQLESLQSRLEAMRRTGAGALFGAVFGGLFGGAQGVDLGALVGAGMMSGPTESILNEPPASGVSSPLVVDSVQEIAGSAVTSRKGTAIEPGPADIAAVPAAAPEREVPRRSATARGKTKGGATNKRQGPR